MFYAYEILDNGYLGRITEYPDEVKGIPIKNTRTAPPEIPEGMYAVWAGTRWIITDVPPPDPNANTTEPVIT